MGPFEIIRKISKVAYELKLPDTWSVHPVFHISLLKPWRESMWSSPVDLQPDDIEPQPKPTYEVERILRWRRVQIGRKENQGVFSGLARLSPRGSNVGTGTAIFLTLNELHKCMLRQDKPVEDKGARF